MNFLWQHWPSVLRALAAQTCLKDGLKVALGSLLFPRSTARWLRFLRAHPGLAGLASAHPRLLHKIYRPYLSNRLVCGERVDLLIGHYGMLLEAGARGLLEAAARRPLTLASVAGKEDGVYELRLSAINDGHREGELCVKLLADGAALYSISFTLQRQAGRRQIRVGALQGANSEHAALWIKRATRNLHGCRPRKLLVAVVRDIGDYFGCGATILVSNRNRIAINARRRRRILADYDEMWREMQARPRAEGDFALSCRGFLCLDFDALPSKKRSEAKKRSALLQDIFA
uniref:DUF535 family protein n=1 Tax=Janthinobacterium sp. TaxID=1871054 RepID=UPI00293D86D0